MTAAERDESVAYFENEVARYERSIERCKGLGYAEDIYRAYEADARNHERAITALKQVEVNDGK